MYKAYSTGDIGHSVKFKDAAEIGAKVGFEGYWFNIVGDSDIPVSETKAILSKNNLIAAGFGLPVEFRADEETFLSDLNKLDGYAKYAAEIGAKRCATWIMPCSDSLTWEENFELHRLRLRKCSEILEKYDIRLGLEFVGPATLRKGKKYEFIHNLDQMLELCDAIGTDNMGLLIDIFHWDTARQTNGDWTKITNKQVVLVHINDAPDVAIEDQEDQIRKLPGETGVLKISEFFNGLKSIGYDGPVIAEPFQRNLSEMPIQDATNVIMTSINKVWPSRA